MHILWNLLLMSIAVFLVAELLPNIRLKNFGTAIIVAIVYSVINFLVGWLLVFLALPLLFLTLGLFKFVINALLLWLTDLFIEDFEIKGFGTTLLAAVLITIFSSFFGWIL